MIVLKAESLNSSSAPISTGKKRFQVHQPSSASYSGSKLPPGIDDRGFTYCKMSLAEFYKLPEKPKSEWIDGWALIMNAPAIIEHGGIQVDIAYILKKALPTCRIVTEAGIKLAHSRRIPDVAAFVQVNDQQQFADAMPVIAVEILSPVTRRQDLNDKKVEYLAAGIRQYWLVDSKLHTVTVLENDGEKAWRTLVELDRDHPKADVVVGKYCTVPLEIADVFQ